MGNLPNANPLVRVLMQACTDPDVELGPEAQRTVLQLSKQHPSLRAALARLEDLDPDVKAALLADTDAEVRRAVLYRTDLTVAERADLLRGERRVTVLQSAAENTSDPDELAMLATKGGKKLSLTVASNPATPYDARLTAATSVVSSQSSYAYRDMPRLRLLLASFPPAAVEALQHHIGSDLYGPALELLPILDVDRVAVLERLVVTVEQHVAAHQPFEMPESFRYVAWMLTGDQRARLETALRISAAASDQQQRYYRLSGWYNLERALQQAPADEFRRACERFVAMVADVRAGVPVETSRNIAGLSSMQTMMLGYMMLMDGTGSVAQAVDTLRAVYGGYGFPDALAALCTTSRQRLIVLGFRNGSEETAEKLARDLPGMVAVAAAEGFWPQPLVDLMVRSDMVPPEKLLGVPLSQLPVQLPSRVLGPLIDRLGDRVSDREWLDLAVTLSTTWDGSVTDLVELADKV